eukprot:g3525.t1
MDLSLDDLIKRDKKNKGGGNGKGGNGKGGNGKGGNGKGGNGEGGNGKNARKRPQKNNNDSRNTKRKDHPQKNNGSKNKKRQRGGGEDGERGGKRRRDTPLPGSFGRRGNAGGKGGKRDFHRGDPHRRQSNHPKQQREESFDFQAAWRQNHVAIQLQGIDMVVCYNSGRLVLNSAGQQNRYYLKAFNLILKVFGLTIQPSGPRMWTIYDTNVPEFRQKFFDGCYVMDSMKSKERMRLRWRVINELYGRTVEEYEPSRNAAPPALKSNTWRPANALDNVADEGAAAVGARSADEELPEHEKTGPIYFLRALCERRGWSAPEFTKEENDDFQLGYTVKLSIFEDPISPSQWHDKDSDAKVNAAKEALDLVREYQKAQKQEASAESSQIGGFEDLQKADDSTAAE